MKGHKIQSMVCWVVLLMLAISPATTIAQKKKRKKGEATQAAPPVKKKNKKGLKSYAEVITAAAKSDDGLFKVHFVDGKLYYEIPQSELGKDMLLVSRIAKIPSRLSPYLNAGSKTNEQVVRWEKKDMKIIVKSISFSSVADENDPISLSVQENNLEPIIYSFDIQALTPDKSGYVIEVTPFFTSDVPAISGLRQRLRKSYKVSRLDKSRTFLDTAKSFPQNIEVMHTMTFNAASPPANSSAQTLTMQMNQSMILLPDDPMMPRMSDRRVGWFSTSYVDYSSDKLKADRKSFIRRWRLEPKDKEAYARGELVEPVKPIIYYLDPATPKKFRPYFKQGIEDWQQAFEVAGFKNAIIAKEPPSPEEDPDFSPEDVRYSVVRYVASTTRNAVGPSVSDPRTGEILESDIIWYHNHLRSYRNRYLLETAGANPKARTLDTPEEEIGEMMRMVIAHEVGHALGLPHNMKASAAYPVDSLRSGSFTQKMGIATTIMDYARYNYVAQPEDENIRFIRQIGPYDKYAINWGYRYIPNATSPDAEKETLSRWIEEHEGDPTYMFGGRNGGMDPTSQTESVGDDNMKASAYGLANLKRVAPNLVEWTTKDGEPYTELDELYGELIGVWSRYIRHVATNIGGVEVVLKAAGQDGEVYNYVPKEQQQRAMAFMQEHVFDNADWLLDKSLLRKIEADGAIERVRGLQARYLNSMLDMGVMQRLIEGEKFEGPQAYTLLEMMDELRAGLFSELKSGASIDVHRRHLQRAYVERLKYLMEENQERGWYVATKVNMSQSDIRPVVRGQLKELSAEVTTAASKSRDRMTRYHLEDLAQRINHILDPK